MDKTVLEQYVELKEEIKDLHNRIDRDRRRLIKIENEGVVSDTVKGTRKDGTFGPIKITGYPFPEVDQVKGMIKKRVAKLHILEDELQDALNAVDDFIREIPQSDLRMMFRFYYLDDMTWMAVAANMNSRFPKRKYTEDSCRKRHDRYLEKNIIKFSKCPVMSASAMVVCILSSEGKTSDDEIPPPIRYERLPGVTAWRLILADISQGLAGATAAEMISQCSLTHWYAVRLRVV